MNSKRSPSKTSIENMGKDRSPSPTRIDYSYNEPSQSPPQKSSPPLDFKTHQRRHRPNNLLQVPRVSSPAKTGSPTLAKQKSFWSEEQATERNPKSSCCLETRSKNILKINACHPTSSDSSIYSRRTNSYDIDSFKQLYADHFAKAVRQCIPEKKSPNLNFGIHSKRKVPNNVGVRTPADSEKGPNCKVRTIHQMIRFIENDKHLQQSKRSIQDLVRKLNEDVKAEIEKVKVS